MCREPEKKQNVETFFSEQSKPGWSGNWPRVQYILQIIPTHPEQCCLISIRCSGMMKYLKNWISPNLCFRHQNRPVVFMVRQILLSWEDQFRLQELQETSSLHCSDRLVSSQAKQKIHMVPAAFFWWIRVRNLFFPKMAWLRQLPGAWMAKWIMRWKVRFLLQELQSSGFEMKCVWLILLRIRNIWQRKSKIQMVVMLCQLLPGWELHTGISMRGGRSLELPVG